ncbi:MAG: bifunctional nicotinamidase/pyrazinamidase [Acidocella sp.]|nr:bifunctional nicotinamidase/pyrazinamidase [Acidocella sp.]
MQNNVALLVVDVQYDFCPGGALAVSGGDEIVPVINSLASRFTHVVITQDWHPPDHSSFAASHPDHAAFETINMAYGPQTLWPTHCVMNSQGAGLHNALEIPHAGLIIRKGSNKAVDSYSAFMEADRKTRTGLDGYFASRGITELYLCGLATDYCVSWSAEDATFFGLKANVIETACRAIDLNGSLTAAWARMAAAGVGRIATL